MILVGHCDIFQYKTKINCKIQTNVAQGSYKLFKLYITLNFLLSVGRVRYNSERKPYYFTLVKCEMIESSFLTSIIFMWWGFPDVVIICKKCSVIFYFHQFQTWRCAQYTENFKIDLFFCSIWPNTVLLGGFPDNLHSWFNPEQVDVALLTIDMSQQ